MPGRGIENQMTEQQYATMKQSMEEEARQWVASPETTAFLLTDLHSSGVTYKRIAEEIGVTYMTIFRWAKGFSKPRPALPVNEKLMLLRNLGEVEKRAAIIAEKAAFSGFRG